jgi:4-alpha-glucanotransferase
MTGRGAATGSFRRWGIEPGYRSALGAWLPSPPASLRRVRDAMEERGQRTATYVDVWVLGAGENRPVAEPSELRLESGDVLRASSYLPRDMPLGYHELVGLETGARTRVIVTPGQCFLPDDLFTWGFAVQLYAVRSRKSWGMGDLSDLRTLSRWSARELGAGMLLVNPLHAATPTLPQQPSPYYPSSRLYRNPLYIDVQSVPGAAELAGAIAPLAARGVELSKLPLIDRNAIFPLKMRALEKLFARFGSSEASASALEAYTRQEGSQLQMYATFSALAEEHGPNWRQWPRGYLKPHGEQVALFRRARARRIRFHTWLQWLIDEQLARAGKEIPLVGDLAVGIDPGGADAWFGQEMFAEGMEVGAPPDEFNTLGQKWGLCPLDPNGLRAQGYEPFVRIVRSAMRHMGGVRLDHVMGLFRLFWIPSGKKPKDGVYVRYPALDLLGIVALESMRQRAYVIGEDLGTVEDDVRRELAYRKLLSYRVLWFERGGPEKYPVKAVATVTTHDLPTIAGLWSGSDLATQKELGLAPNEAGTLDLRRSLGKLIGAKSDAKVNDVVIATHAALARAPSVLVTATLDDALAVEQRPNMPGTIDEYPSWCVPLPSTVEQIMREKMPRAIARVLGKRKRAVSGKPRGRKR